MHRVSVHVLVLVNRLDVRYLFSPFRGGCWSDRGDALDRDAIDRSIDRRITKPCPSSALCEHVCAPRRGSFPGQRGGGHFGDSADARRSIDPDRRDWRGSLSRAGPPIWPWAPNVYDCDWNLESTRGERASERAGERATARERTACASLLHYVGYMHVVCVHVKWVHACSHARSARERRYFVSLWVTDQIRRIPLPAVLPDADQSSSNYLLIICINNLFQQFNAKLHLITEWIIIMGTTTMIIFWIFIYLLFITSLYFLSKGVNNIH